MKSKKEIIELAHYLRGFADSIESQKMADASDILLNYSKKVCGQGFICNGGDTCGSDHK